MASLSTATKSSWKAHVKVEPLGRYAEVYIYSDYVAVSADGTMYTLAEGTDVPDGFVPFNIPTEALRGLRDSLNDWLGDTPEKFSQEAYAREVARNEKITNVLISLALNGMDDAVS